MSAFAKVFTYDATLRQSLAAMWVPSLATVLDAFDAGADIYADRGSWSDLAIAAHPDASVGRRRPRS